MSWSIRQMLVPAIVGLVALVPRSAAGQCGMDETEDVVIGFGTAVRMAVDPTTQTPVVLWEDPELGLVYRRFLGPDWGVTVEVDTEGQLLPEGDGGVMVQGTDLLIDGYGRPRVVLVNHEGLFHTRYTAGWSPLTKLMDVSLGPIGLGAVQIRLEQDAAERAHVLLWTDVWTGGGSGRRSYHLYDGGSGFGPETQFGGGAWTPRGKTDSHGDLHIVGIDDFPPDPPNQLHQFQAVYWQWSAEGGMPDQHERITFEPNPATGNGAGPVGFSPEIAIDGADQLHVVYPMHETDDAQDGELHYIQRSSGDWSEPVSLFPCNGHGGQPVIAIDSRGTKLVVSLVYDKYWAVDFGEGFGPGELWDGNKANWQFHDLVQTRGLFWHAFIPKWWNTREPGDIVVHTFRKTGSCPGVPADDADDDGVPEADDLCPGVPDPAQGDADGDGLGDGCDEDDDDDGVPDTVDRCPRLADPAQTDSDDDGIGDACANLVDDDQDGVLAPWDCDDADPESHPGHPEQCDGKDNDCDGQGDPASCGDDGGGGGAPGGGDLAGGGAHAEGASDDAASGISGSCGCRAAGASRRAGGVLASLLLSLLVVGRRRRRGTGHEPASKQRSSFEAAA